jgi:hypothetical protein
VSHTVIIDLTKDVALAVGALTVAGVAVLGFVNWRRDCKARTESEIIRALLHSVYQLKDEIGVCRFPFVTHDEFPREYVGSPKSTAEDEGRALAYVYKNRWKSVRSALQEFDVRALQAEAIWGDELRTKMDKLRGCVETLNAAIGAVVADKVSGGRNFQSDEALGHDMQTKVSVSSSDRDNALSNAIEASIKDIEDFLRSRQDRKS